MSAALNLNLFDLYVGISIKTLLRYFNYANTHLDIIPVYKCSFKYIGSSQASGTSQAIGNPVDKEIP